MGLPQVADHAADVAAQRYSRLGSRRTPDVLRTEYSLFFFLIHFAA